MTEITRNSGVREGDTQLQAFVREAVIPTRLHAALAAAFLVAFVLDLATTHVLLTTTSATELNPVVAAALQQWGLLGHVGVKVALLVGGYVLVTGMNLLERQEATVLTCASLGLLWGAAGLANLHSLLAA